MPIVRELVTKLGFQVDKSGLERFEKSVLGFKTKFTLAASAIALATTKTLNQFSEIAKGAVDLQELARNTKLADNEFIALRRTAEDFQIDPKQFDKNLSTLSKLLREAKTGYGELYEIQKKSRGQLNLVQFVKNGDIKGAIGELIRYVKSLDDVQNKIAAISDILGEESVNGFLRIAEGGADRFFQLVEQNKEFANSFLKSTEGAKDFQKALNDLYKEFSYLKDIVVGFALPLVTKLTEGAAFLLGKRREEGTVATVGEALKYLKDSTVDFLKNLGSPETKIGVNTPHYTNAQINNRVEVNVPAGTSEENAKIIGAEVRNALENLWDEKTREVINNNPQVE